MRCLGTDHSGTLPGRSGRSLEHRDRSRFRQAARPAGGLRSGVSMSVRPASNSDDDALQCRPPGWRGEGIAFPTRGALRITNLSLRINADGELVPSPVTAEVRADT